MSDDLISRKAAYKAFSDYLNKCFVGEISSHTELNIGEIASVIKSIPAAFDKEEVIKKLEEAGQKCNEANDICGAEAIDYAIGVVEEGGVE